MQALRKLLLALVLLPALGATAHAALGLPSPSQLISDLIGKLTGGSVKTQGISGWPNSLHIDRLELTDADGSWLIAEDVTLDWHPYKLISKEADIDLLKAARLQLPRLQAATPSTPAAQSSSSGLPIKINIKQLHADRIDLGAPVLGAAASISLDGSLSLPSLMTPSAHLVAHRLDGGGDYKVDAEVTDERIDATITVAEPEHGLVAQAAKLPDIGPLKLDARLVGPRASLAAKLALSAGPLSANAAGTLDLPDSTLDLQVSANAPAMKPAPEVSWNSIQLQARVQGPFTKPNADGHLTIASLQAAGAAVKQLAADVKGNAGKVSVHAVAEGVQAPLPKADLFAQAPITLDLTAQLDDPARPITFTLSHPLIAAQGTAKTAGPLEVTMDLRVPQLDPFTTLAGIDLHGATAVRLHATMQDGVSKLDGDGTLTISSGLAPLPGLIGENAKVGLTMQAKGQDLTISRMTVNGKTLDLSLTGARAAGKLTGDIKAALSQLSVVAPTLSGAITTTAHIAGTPEDLAVNAHVEGEVGAPGVKRGPVTVDAALRGLPNAPAGTITAQGRLANAPAAARGRCAAGGGRDRAGDDQPRRLAQPARRRVAHAAAGREAAARQGAASLGTARGSPAVRRPGALRLGQRDGRDRQDAGAHSGRGAKCRHPGLARGPGESERADRRPAGRPGGERLGVAVGHRGVLGDRLGQDRRGRAAGRAGDQGRRRAHPCGHAVADQRRGDA